MRIKITCPYCNTENDLETMTAASGKALMICAATHGCSRDFAVFWKTIVSTDVFPLGPAAEEADKISDPGMDAAISMAEMAISPRKSLEPTPQPESRYRLGVIKQTIMLLLDDGPCTTDEIRDKSRFLSVRILIV